MFSDEGNRCFSGARVEEAAVEAAIVAAAFLERVSRAGRS